MRRLAALSMFMVLITVFLIACNKDDSSRNLSIPKGQACGEKGVPCVRAGTAPTPVLPTPAPPQNSAPDEFVIDIAVVHSSDGPGVACPSGYEKREPDLNLEAGGDWVYLCLKYGTLTNGQRPLSYISVIYTGTDISGYATPPCWTAGNPGEFMKWSNVDLNYDAGGYFMYFCYGNHTSNSELTYYRGEPRRLKDVQFVAFDSAVQIPCLGFSPLTVDWTEPGQHYYSWEMLGQDVAGGVYQRALDLNLDAGGKCLYGCAFYN